MATIVDNQNLTDDLVDGKIESSAITSDPTLLRIQTEVTNSSSEDYFLFQTYQVNDGNGYADLLDENNRQIKHKIKGNDIVSINLLNVNSANIKVILTPGGVHDGDLSVYSKEL